MKNKNYKLYSSDIETILISQDNEQTYIHIPIVISLTNEFKTKSFSIKDKEKIIEQSNEIISEYLKYIKEYGESLNIIYFHNLANFDGFFILKYLIEQNIKPQVINRFNKILSIEFTIDNTHYKILDSYLMIPYSLKEACKIYNEVYQKTEFDFNNLNLKNLNNDIINQLTKYCCNDTKALFELITNFNNILIKEFNKPIYSSITLSSYSYNLYLNQYYNHDFISLETKHDDFIRKAYYGGIVDVFKPYGEDIINLDINSAYPYIMHNTLFPIQQPEFQIAESNIELTLKKYPNSFIKCEIICEDNNKYPILPYRDTKKSKLIQPTGQWIGTYWSEEISYALSTGYYKIKPISLYYYQNMDYIFKDYINHLYNLRKKYKTNNNKPGELLTKKLMNTLYGRTAINTDNYNIKFQTTEEFFKSKNNIIDYIPTTNNTIITINKEKNNETSNNISLKILKSRVDWAAIITSKSRINIHKLITTPKLNVYYTDTDSIFIDRKNINIIKDKISQNLGDLKIVDDLKGKTEAIFIAPKTYILKNNNKIILKMKGISTNDHNIKNDDIFNIFKEKLYKYSRKNIKISNKTINFYKNIKKLTIEKKIMKSTIYTLDYTKRTKIYDSSNIWIDTKPIRIEESNKITNKNNKIENIIKPKNYKKTNTNNPNKINIKNKFNNLIDWIINNIK